MALPQVIDITKKGQVDSLSCCCLLNCLMIVHMLVVVSIVQQNKSLLLQCHGADVGVKWSCSIFVDDTKGINSHIAYNIVSADGPSPREKLANQLASVLEMRRRKQKVSCSCTSSQIKVDSILNINRCWRKAGVWWLAITLAVWSPLDSPLSPHHSFSRSVT